MADFASGLFVIVEMYFLARLVPANEVPGGYFSFVTIGLVIAAFVAAGLTAMSAAVRQEQTQGTLEVTLTQGLSPMQLGVALASYPMVAAVIRAFLFGVLGLILGAHYPGGNWLLAVCALAIGSLSFVGLGLLAVGLVLVVRQAAALVAWGIGLLTFAAGVVFPTTVLPAVLQRIASISPVTITLKVVRDAALGASWSAAFPRLLLLMVEAVIALAAGVFGVARGLRWARRTGALAQY